MPGVYVANRGGGVTIGRAGLALPFTPSTGPIPFAQDWTGYLNVPMNQHHLGPAANVQGGGIQTHDISECAVFAAAQLTGRPWGMVYFAHVQGGYWHGNAPLQKAAKGTLEDYAQAINLDNCYSLLVCPIGSGYGGFAEFPQQLGFPGSKMSVYVTNTRQGLGVAIEFRVMGEFGEIDNPAPKRTLSGPFGRQMVSNNDAYRFFD